MKNLRASLGQMRLLAEIAIRHVKFGLALSLCSLLGLSCSGCKHGGGEENFRDNMNAAVGYPVKDWERYPHKEVSLGDGRTEYQFTNKEGGSWAFIVSKDGIVESWKYLSDPSLCKVPFGLGPF